VKRSSFKTPASLTIDGRRIDISTPPGDAGADGDFIVCFLDDEYGLDQVGNPPRTILDVGANIGFFTLAARRRFPDAVIHAYEPNPRTRRYCDLNTRSLNVAIFGEALGATAGEVRIVDPGDTNQARTWQGDGPGVPVPQVTLETAVARLGGHIDLAKFDCEGAEWDLFQDAAAWNRISLVRMEYHCWRDHTYAQVESAFDKLGFTIRKHRPSGAWGSVWAINNRL